MAKKRKPSKVEKYVVVASLHSAEKSFRILRMLVKEALMVNFPQVVVRSVDKDR